MDTSRNGVVTLVEHASEQTGLAAASSLSEVAWLGISRLQRSSSDTYS